MKTTLTIVLLVILFGMIGSASERKGTKDFFEVANGFLIVCGFISVILWIWGIAP